MRRSALVGGLLALLSMTAFLLPAAQAAAPDTGAYIHPQLAAMGLDTPEKVELLSSVRLQTTMLAGLYRPTAGSPLRSILDPSASGAEPPAQASAGPRAPPFGTNVRVSDDLKEKQNEISVDSDVGGNLYAGWNDNRLFDGSGGKTADYRCGFSGSKDGGKTWTANDLYQGPKPEGGDAVVVAHGNVIWRLCMSFTRGANSAAIMISKSTDGGTTWGSWIDASRDSTLNDKPWMDFDGDRLYFAVYEGSINFWKSDDGGATFKPKQNLGSGQGNCILAGNNGVVLVGWGSSSRMMRSTDYGGSFTMVKSGFVSGGGGSNPRSSPLSMCAKDSARQNMYYTWASSGSGSENVYVMHSGDEGATWETPVRVAPGSNRQVMPGIDVSTDGVVHVAWSEWKGGNMYSYYSNSTDKGKTWLPAIEITSANSPIYTGFMGDYQQLDASATDRIGYVWCDTRENAAGDTYWAAYDYKKGGGGGGNGSIARIDVSPATATITADQTQQFTAAAYDQNNKQVNATFTWTASSGSISPAGLFTPAATGSISIAAIAGGKTGTASITVLHGALVSLEINPQNPTVKADATQQFLLDGKDAKGNSWNIANATWTVTGGSGAGTISATGLYTPDKVGKYTVEGTDPVSAMKGSTQVTVDAGAAKTVEVAPPTATITADDTQQFTAAAKDAKGNVVPATFKWIYNDGTVDSTGLFTPQRVGTWKVGAQAGNAYAEATVTVTPGKLAAVEVTPDGQTITADQTLQLKARGLDSKGNEIASPPTWEWSASKGSVDAAGLYAPQEAGDQVVKAGAGGVEGSAKVKVTPGKVAKIVVDPPTASVDKGGNVNFRATMTDAKGNAVAGTPAWELAGDQVGSIDGTGKFTGRDAGEATVRATKDGAVGEAKVMVRGGLTDIKGGGQLPFLLAALIAVAVIAAVAMMLVRKKKKAQQQAYSPGQPMGPPGMPPDQWQQPPQQWDQGYGQPGHPGQGPDQGQWPPQ